MKLRNLTLVGVLLAGLATSALAAGDAEAARAEQAMASKDYNTAISILEAALNNRQIKITRTDKEPGGKTVTYTDQAATAQANEVAKSIGQTGHVALYGIFFDTDKAELKAESTPTLTEIATLLGSDPKLAVLIVGHTDNKGDKEMNQPRLGDVTDQKGGYDFKLVKTIRKSGDQQFPNYEGSHFLEQSPAGTPEEWSTWIENLHDLEALRILKTAEELEHELQVHLGVKQESSGGFDPSKFAKTVAAASAPSPAPVAASARVESESDDDDEVADKDFIEELKRLG